MKKYLLEILKNLPFAFIFTSGIFFMVGLSKGNILSPFIELSTLYISMLIVLTLGTAFYKGTLGKPYEAFLKFRKDEQKTIAKVIVQKHGKKIMIFYILPMGLGLFFASYSYFRYGVNVAESVLSLMMILFVLSSIFLTNFLKKNKGESESGS